MPARIVLKKLFDSKDHDRTQFSLSLVRCSAPSGVAMGSLVAEAADGIGSEVLEWASIGLPSPSRSCKSSESCVCSLSRPNMRTMWRGQAHCSLLRVHARHCGFASSHFFFRRRHGRQPVLVRGLTRDIIRNSFVAGDGGGDTVEVEWRLRGQEVKHSRLVQLVRLN